MTNTDGKRVAIKHVSGKPYIFVCYAHADTELMHKDLEQLNEAGFSIWYDEAITLGREWREDIANAINGCSLFLTFISHHSVNSLVCKKEIAFASQSGNPVLAVWLEDVELSPGIALAIGDTQALMRFRIDRAEYEKQLFNCVSRSLEKTAGDKLPIEPGEKLFRLSGLHRLLVALTIACVLVFSLWHFIPGPQDKKVSPVAAEFSFHPRDWLLLVVKNHTPNALFEGSLEMALRVALRQSAYINLLSPAMTIESLNRMNRPSGEPLDARLGLELAVREGLAAVLEMNVRSSGSDYLITATVLDPKSEAAVFESTVQAHNDDEVLPQIAFLAELVRKELGESEAAIQANNTSLVEATTSNLTALKIYSAAIDDMFSVSLEDTVEQLEQAIRLDPNFALAHAKLATTLSSMDRDRDLAKQHWDAAGAQMEHVTQRERLYIDASRAWLESPAEMQRRWQLLARIYPDEIAAHHNLGIVRWQYQNNFIAAIGHYRDAINLKNVALGTTYHDLGYVLLGSGQTREAIKAFEKARETTEWTAGIADAYVVLGDYDEANRQLVNQQDLSLNQQIPRLTRLIGIEVDQGKLTIAYDLAGEGLRIARKARSNLSEMGFAGARLAIDEKQGEELLSHQLDITIELIQSLITEGDLWRYPTRELALTGKIAARNGHVDRAARLLRMIMDNVTHEGDPMSQDYENLLAGEIALAKGDSDNALALFTRITEQSNLFTTHESLARTYRGASSTALEMKELEWMLAHKGQALAEISLSVFGREINLLDIAYAKTRLEQIK